ncbi:MAG: hypothetical protein ACYCO4_06510 [Sulfobacillus sp.]
MMTLINVALEQLSWQLRAYESLDRKATSILAFDVAFLAVVLAARALMAPLKWVSVGLDGVSILATVVALWVVEPYIGPDVGKLWATAKEEGMDPDEAVLGSLAADVRRNVIPLDRKAVYWIGAAGFLVASVAVAGIAFIGHIAGWWSHG